MKIRSKLILSAVAATLGCALLAGCGGAASSSTASSASPAASSVATIDYAQTEGIEKGMQEGMQKGMQKGIEKGIEKGRQEEKLQIAQKMKEQGLDSELIAQCSGLSVEDIERL